MKKNDFYALKIYIVGCLVSVLLLIIGVSNQNAYLLLGALIISLIIFIVFIKIIKSRFNKYQLLHEKEFGDDFNHDFKFISDSAAFYFNDNDGKIAVIWKNNPKEVYFLDPNKITNIYTKDGRQFNNGTSLVSARFKYDGKNIKIFTLKVYNGTYHMQSEEVLEAIAKADFICQKLNIAKQNV